MLVIDARGPSLKRLVELAIPAYSILILYEHDQNEENKTAFLSSALRRTVADSDRHDHTIHRGSSALFRQGTTPMCLVASPTDRRSFQFPPKRPQEGQRHSSAPDAL